jgi:hypothetical protein
MCTNMNLDDTVKPTQFSDSACTCKSCYHRIASDCIKANCNCCTNANHSMVLDGIEGFTSLHHDSKNTSSK